MIHYLTVLGTSIASNWPMWLVALVLIVAAVIDGIRLKVPNWLTFPMIIGGWLYSVATFGWEGLLWSITGTLVGLALLLPAYAIGGMGAGDVKLLAGVGAWVHATHTFHSFCVSALVGAVIALVMVVSLRSWRQHWNQFWIIAAELCTIRDPNELSAIAAKRKNSMLLLPYGIPIAIGTISYFAWEGMLI